MSALLKECFMFSGLTKVLNKQQYQFKRGVGNEHSSNNNKQYIFSIFGFLLLISFWLAGCSGINVGGVGSASSTKGVTATIAALPQVALADLHWCGKPVLIFRDEGATKINTPTATTSTPSTSVTPTDTVTPIATPKTLTDWQQVEPNLGFSVFLPQTLPQGSCLISASGTIHDPTFGGIFTIGYVLPDHDAISLSEAPLASQSSNFQCSPSSSTTSGKSSSTPTPGPTVDPVQLCTGARGNTNVVLSARGATSALEQLFSALQTNVAWVPVA